MNTCRNCGAQLSEGLCRYCGSDFREEIHEKKKREEDRQRQLEAELKNKQDKRVIHDVYVHHLDDEDAIQAYQGYSDQKPKVYKTKSRFLTFLICLFTGFFGGHYFYVGRWGMGILYFFTVGLFGIGWLFDLVKIGFGHFKDKNDRII